MLVCSNNMAEEWTSVGGSAMLLHCSQHYKMASVHYVHTIAAISHNENEVNRVEQKVKQQQHVEEVK